MVKYQDIRQICTEYKTGYLLPFYLEGVSPLHHLDQNDNT